MDCIRLIRSERRRLDDRKVSAAFHLAVIEQALHLVADQLAAERLRREEAGELQAACAEALEALAELRAAGT
ncbi:MAG: hypothetical protein ACK4P2_05585 [Hyphomonas sp.]